jgi:hypothetical protein
MKKICFLIVLFSFVGLYSQDDILPQFFYNKYKGKIGDREAVLELMKDDSLASGFFYFTDNREPYYIDQQGSFIKFDKQIKFMVINDYDSLGNAVYSNYFAGKFASQNVIDGLFYSKDLKIKPEKFVFIQDLTDDYARIKMESVVLTHFLTDKRYNAKLSINLPVLSNSKSQPLYSINDSIKKFFFVAYTDSTVNVMYSFEDYVGNWYKNIKSALDDIVKFQTDSGSMSYLFENWNTELNFFVEMNQGQILSMAKYVDEFLGGLHPVSNTQYLNFDIQTQKLLKIEDLFESDKIIKIKNLAEQKFYQMENLDYKLTLDEQGYWFENDRFFLPENFGLRVDGIKFIFNPYEVSSFARGVIEIFIPYSEIKEFIRSDSKLFRFVK